MSGRPAPALMIQGTHSDAGKSLIVAGLCRLFANRGLSVAPFKPQNMSNNAAATPPLPGNPSGEIGRAQALQALACRRPASVHMNPVLLKPESETGAQVILQGRRIGHWEAQRYFGGQQSLLPAVLESFRHIQAESDLVIVEGAGSPAEINLRQGDIANMGFARAAEVPVVLLGDIERGGSIASLVGTHTVLAPEDAAMIRGFLINKFRGDPALFDTGLGMISARTGWPGLGVIPWFARAHLLPPEDAVPREGAPDRSIGNQIRIVIPCAPGIANFDDADPLRAEADVEVVFIGPGKPLPMDADLILLPGSKTTLSDLAFLRAQGWDIDIRAHLRQGKPVFGLCGGFQMLGRLIRDPLGLEGPAGEGEGLGLLDFETTLAAEKTIGPIAGHALAEDAPVAGYEIHAGQSRGPALARPLLRLEDGRADGAASGDGLVRGIYLHGIFGSDDFRRAFLKGLRPGHAGGSLAHAALVDSVLDDLAAHLARHADIGALERIAGL